MLLYSTRFPVKDTFTKEKFISLVIKWNQGSPHDKMETLIWDGNEKKLKCTENNRFLAIEELRAEDTVAARFRKDDENGIIWTTDFVLNASEHMLAVKLDRETTIDTRLFIPRFNPPHFVKMVISEGYAGMDSGIEISAEPVRIDKSNYKVIENAIKRTTRYMLPVIYVTKTWSGNYPVSVQRLAKRLQGVAHVLKESDIDVSKLLMKNCDSENVHHGGIGIYFPSQSAQTRKINTVLYAGKEDVLIEKISTWIYRYANQQIQEQMYTWDGIQNKILCLKYESLSKKREEVVNENNELYSMFEEYDIQLSEQEKMMSELNKKIAALEQENQGLRNKLDGMEEVPVLCLGDEEELYEGEIREIILDILYNSLKRQTVKSRRNDVLKDIIENNNFQKVAESKQERIKKILKGYSNMPHTMRQELQDFGFSIESERKHYKLIYYNDQRYAVTMSKSSSDHRAGSNLASEIIKNIL